MLWRGLCIIGAAFVFGVVSALTLLAGAARTALKLDEATDVEEED